jgi:4-hydroxy-4-methyl-2-oxoglutarate aldolase
LSGRVQQPRERPSVTALTDALGRAPNHQANVLDLVSPTPGRVPFGIGLTIRFLSYREDLFREQVNSFARCFYAAIGNKLQGKVIVCDSAGYGNTSVGGGTKLARLNNTGVAGLITGARLRDFRELAEYDSVFYCAGKTVLSSWPEIGSVAGSQA